jgi:hypothetical protein
VQAALDQAGAAAEQFRLRTIINDQVVAADRAQLHADVKYQQLHAAAKYQALEIAMERAAHTAAIQQMTLQMQLNSAMWPLQSHHRRRPYCTSRPCRLSTPLGASSHEAHHCSAGLTQHGCGCGRQRIG